LFSCVPMIGGMCREGLLRDPVAGLAGHAGAAEGLSRERTGSVRVHVGAPT